MYLEKNKNTLLLVKKVMGKKISVALRGETVLLADIMALSQKEITYLQTTAGYALFLSQIFSPEQLPKILLNALVNKNLEFLLDEEKLANQHRDFAIRFIYESNKTEGSKIPIDEVAHIIQEKKYTYKVKNEIQEVKNSLKAWDFLQKDFRFTLTHIKRLYHTLTKGLIQENGRTYPRGFKKIPVVVNNSPTTPPENVASELRALITWYQQNRSRLFPLQLAFDFHLRFEQIHPFENGNGRIGRLIMNKILLANNLSPCIIFAENRRSYFSAIASTKAQNKKKYYQFMLSQYTKTLKRP